MKSEKEVEAFARELINKGALSAFLYGSRATGDALKDSDWEIGAIFDDSKYVSRSELAALSPKGVVIYPFKLSELKNARPETPFTRSIWMNEIILTGKMLAGPEILKNIEKPEITKEDLLQDAAFYKARALDAMIAKRLGHEELAKDLFVKSCLLGLRNLVLHNGGKFPKNYEEIVDQSNGLLSEEYSELPKLALAVRKSEAELTLDMTFKNIGLFTEVIEGNT